jgi:hypothetical protein
MIYCDGEREQFDEKEFYRLHDGTLLKPCIHLPTQNIPAHFADSGLPFDLKVDEHDPDKPTIVTTNPTPISVSLVKPRLDEDTLRKIDRSLASSESVDVNAAHHYARLDWPQPISIDTATDLLADQKKALYLAQLQIVTGKQQGLIDHDKAVRANDYPQHQAVFQAYIDVAKGQIDRSVTRAQFVSTAASAIGTVYSAVIGLSFGLLQADHTLPARGIAPAVFLGLAIACAAAYLAYINTSSRIAETQRPVSLLPAQRLIEERNDFIQWATLTVTSRVHWLHAAVISLAIGVIFLPIPFLAISDWLAWVGLGIGIVVVCIPLVTRFLPFDWNGKRL